MRNADSAKRTLGGLVVLAGMMLLAAAPASADAPVVADVPDPPAATDSKTSGSADGPTPVAEPAPVPHLSSPENLPPYTTETPDGSQDFDRLSYFKDVWHAVQQHEVTPSQALVLLAQQPMDAGPDIRRDGNF